MSSEPVGMVLYDKMVNAIAKCHQTDELAEIHNKALAIERYARQAKNTDAERKASEIRLRAERKWGMLAKQLVRLEHRLNGKDEHGTPVQASNGGTPERSPYSEAIAKSGISKQTANRWQALASIPDKDFEDALSNPQEKPTTAKLIREIRAPTPKMPDDSLWIWGRLLDLERGGYFRKDPNELMHPMTDAMQSDIRRIVPIVADFFNHFAEVINESA